MVTSAHAAKTRQVYIPTKFHKKKRRRALRATKPLDEKCSGVGLGKNRESLNKKKSGVVRLH